MECDKIQEYLDRCLDPGDTRQFEDHLSQCRKCRVQVDEWQEISVAAASFDAGELASRLVQPSEADISRFEKMAREYVSNPAGLPCRSPKRFSRFFVPAIAASVLVGVGAIFLGLLRAPNGTDDTFGGEAASQGTTSPVAQAQPSASRSTSLASEEIAPSSVPLPAVTFASEVRELTGKTELQASKDKGQCAHMGPDTMCLYPAGRARVTLSSKSHTVHLMSGSALFQVEPGQTRRFEVTTPLGTVQVVGTRFSVTVTPDESLKVVVEKGVVRVAGDNKSATVEAGTLARVVSGKSEIETRVARDAELETFSILSFYEREGEAAQVSSRSGAPMRRSESGTEAPTLDTWRQKMISGDLDAAEVGLSRRVRRHPDDTDASFLLATCLKRKGSPKEALALYQKLSRHAAASVSNRASYLAGEVCLKQLSDPGCALRYFTPFLNRAAADASGRAEASYYKAEALIQLGRVKEAEKILQSVVDTYGRTSIGRRAQNRLRDLQR